MNKQFKLVGLLIALAAAFFWFVDPAGWFGPDEQELAADDPGQRVLCDLSADDITAFTITKPDEGSFRIERKDGEWWVAALDRRVKVRKERIDKLIEDVPGLRAEALLTSKPEKHADFEVDDAQGIVLSMDTAGEVDAVKLVVGKAAPGYKGAFVRVGTGADVYRADKNLKSLVGFSIDDYKTRKPWEFDPALAESISILPPEAEEPLEFTKSGTFWQTADGSNANQNMLTELLDKFSKLQISSYADDTSPEESRLEEAAERLVVSGPFGRVGIKLGNKQETSYYATDETGSVYRVTEYNLKFLNELDVDELSFDDTADMEPAESPDQAAAPSFPDSTEQP